MKILLHLYNIDFITKCYDLSHKHGEMLKCMFSNVTTCMTLDAVCENVWQVGSSVVYMVHSGKQIDNTCLEMQFILRN